VNNFLSLSEPDFEGPLTAVSNFCGSSSTTSAVMDSTASMGAASKNKGMLFGVQ
jgi:hypothetical protein